MKIILLVLFVAIAVGKIECTLLPRLTFNYCQNVVNSKIKSGSNQMVLLTFNYCSKLVDTVKKDYEVKSFNETNYYFSKSQKDWKNGELACVELGGHLTSIHSLSEYNFIYYAANRKYGNDGEWVARVWIGLNDLKVQGQYVWSDGTPTDFTHWIKGEPNNHLSKEQCVLIWQFAKGYNNAGWNDSTCPGSAYYVCKI